MIADIVAPLLLGFAFGWCLHKAGLTHYARIANVYRLQDLTVLRFMLTALIVAAVLIRVGADLGFGAVDPAVPQTSMLANVTGGFVFGVGMAGAGYCPGTILAEAGEGRLDAWIGGFTGLLAGAIAFGLLEPSLLPALARTGTLGRVTFASLVDANPWFVLLVFVESALLLLVLTASVGRSRP
jgi:hypothetical protein